MTFNAVAHCALQNVMAEAKMQNGQAAVA